MKSASVPPFPWKRLIVKSVSGTWHVVHTADAAGDWSLSRTCCTRLVKVAAFADPFVPAGFNPMKVCCDCDWRTWGEIRDWRPFPLTDEAPVRIYE